MQSQNSLRTAVVGSVIAAFLLVTSACSAPAHSANISTGEVAMDPKAAINVSPVDYNGFGVVRASFADPDRRPVSLQRKADAGWVEVTTGTEDRSGQVDFQVKEPTGTFRAVAAATTSGAAPRPAVATPSASSGDQWQNVLDSDFPGDALDGKVWANRFGGIYDAGGRACSASYASNAVVADNKLTLSVTEETEQANIAKATAAGCTERGHYRNAMIGTEKRFALKSGLVAAKLKFPVGQGIHGGVWLQSYSKSEIDLIESYGYGRGLTNIVHLNGQQYPKKASDTFVNIAETKDRGWWDQYHVYSVEWTTAEVVFRIDGQVTQRVKQTTPDTEYFIVVSLLSSDWEQKRFTKPFTDADNVQLTTLPQSMTVDWVKAWSRA